MSKDSKKADLLPQGVEKDASVVLAVRWVISLA
jgi:hypothetical protein